jgi:hypothetical protein
VDLPEFVHRYPTLYHMADEAAWPSIQRHGLLSSKGLVDLFEPEPSVRVAALSEVRGASIPLRRDGLDAVTIRDQLPLKFLDECLQDGVSRQDYLDALNGRVYFWLAEQRLERLLKARAYKSRRHLILHIDTAALLDAYGSKVELAPYNTGSAHVPNAPKRGPGVFVPFASYPFDHWRRKRGRNGEHVVELTVPYAVPDVVKFVRRAELRHGIDAAVVVFGDSH